MSSQSRPTSSNYPLQQVRYSPAAGTGTNAAPLPSRQSNQQQQQQQQQEQYDPTATSQTVIPLNKQVSFNFDDTISLSVKSQKNTSMQQQRLPLHLAQQQSQTKSELIEGLSPINAPPPEQTRPNNNYFRQTNANNTNNNNRNSFSSNSQQLSTAHSDINRLVQQSNLALRSLEDQFKNQPIKPSASFSSTHQANNHSTGSSGNIQQLKSDVDRLIQQAQQQSRSQQITLAQPYNDIRTDSNYSSMRFTDDRSSKYASKRSESQSKKKKKSKSKKKMTSKKYKKHRRNYSSSSSSSNASSLSSSRSSSVIEERFDESRFDDSSFDENDINDEKPSKRKSRNKHNLRNSQTSANKPRDYSSSTNNNRKQSSVISQKQSQSAFPSKQQSTQQQVQHEPPKNEQQQLSVHSVSASKIKRAKVNSIPSPISGFRRCPDDDDKNDFGGDIDVSPPQLLRFSDNDDSFDINDDFIIHPSVESTSKKNRSVSRSRKQRLEIADNSKSSKVSNQSLISKDTTAKPRQRFELKLDQNQRRKQDWQSSEVASMPDTNSIIVQQYQQQPYLKQQQRNPSQQYVEDDSLVFCINCEEYIRSERVDEHSNVCQSNKQEISQQKYLMREDNTKTVLDRINEKLVKVCFLIKNKYAHVSAITTTIGSLSSFYEQLLTITNVSIEINSKGKELEDAEMQIRVINAKLERSESDAAHSLLYLSQKLFEFVSRKRQFLERYGDSNLNAVMYRDDMSNNTDSISITSAANSLMRNKQSIQQQSQQQQQQHHHQLFQEPVRMNTQPRANSIQIFAKTDENLKAVRINTTELSKPPPQSNGTLLPPKSNRNSNSSNRVSAPFSVKEPTMVAKMAMQQPVDLMQQQRYELGILQNQQPRQVNVKSLSQQQPFSQIISNEVTDVVTVNVQESQILPAPKQQQPFYKVDSPYKNKGFVSSPPFVVTAPLASTQLKSEPKDKKLKFFTVADRMKAQYPMSNQYLISNLWLECESNKIPESEWTQFLAQKFSH